MIEEEVEYRRNRDDKEVEFMANQHKLDVEH